LEDKKITNDAGPQKALWKDVHNNLYHLINLLNIHYRRTL
jgi:hypothetical protein